MSDWDDLERVTPRISSHDAERLLSGTPVDETHELADLSAVLGALRQSAEPDELSGLDSVLAAFGPAVVTAHADLPPTQRTVPMTKKRLTRKSLAAIGVITLVSAGAAAAGGVVSTPFSAQRPSVAKSMHFASKDSTDDTDADETTVATDEVDSDELTAATEAPDATDGADDTTVGTDGQGPDVNGPAKFGLCTAYAARTKHDEVTDTTAPVTPTAEPTSTPEPVTVDSLPVPFQNLTDAADAAGQTVAEFCADAVPGGKDEAPGKSGDNPSETAPGQSEDNPSVTAPGQSDDNASTKARGKSGAGHGHSTTTLAGS